MKKMVGILAMTACLAAFGARADDAKENEAMKMKMTFEDKTVVVTLADNGAAKQLAAMLPETFEFIDFANQEKIAEFKKPVSLAGAPRGMIASKGKMFIYAPWGNLGFFYKNHGTTPDENLIELGEVQSGLEHLAAQKGGFTAHLELMTEEK